MQHHLNSQHRFAHRMCAACHQGDEAASREAEAHEGMIASPGNLDNADKTCATCHAQHVAAVNNSVMHTGENIVNTTREVLQPTLAHQSGGSFQRLGHGLADSMLRKLCASCHLGHHRRPGKPNPVTDRGGGCLACHLNSKPDDAHPELTAKVEDARCFGCHSRSGRISLSYAGLAEVDANDENLTHQGLARMPDGRLVKHQQADLHHQAGMSCIDCHTGTGLMGLNAKVKQHGVDISCRDCHDNDNPRVEMTNWPSSYRSMLDRVPFQTINSQVFLQTAAGTPLAHISVSGNGIWLYPKLGGRPLRIPQIRHTHLSLMADHERLSCDACHATWVPTCLGCHMGYEEQGQQWDHSLQQVTSGVWHEKRWAIEVGPPTLGLKDRDTIDAFVPGMIMTLHHPQLDETLFIRRFARISPHTTGRSRSCKDCHLSTVMMGLGKGRLTVSKEKIQFLPDRDVLVDGLPADAWTSLSSEGQPNSIGYPRPLSAWEIRRLYWAIDGKQSDDSNRDAER